MDAPRAETTAERRLAQWAICRTLKQKANNRHQQGHHDKNGGYSQKGIERARHIAADKQGKPQVGANGKQVAVGKVDELEHAVHHGVAQRHKRIDAAHG